MKERDATKKNEADRECRVSVAKSGEDEKAGNRKEKRQNDVFWR